MAVNREENVNVYDNFMKLREKIVKFDCFESDEEWDDIIDLLPNDPFGMDYYNLGLPNYSYGAGFDASLPKDPFGMDFNMGSAFASIWREDFSLKDNGFERDEAPDDGKYDDNSKFCAEFNFVWAGSMMYEEDEVVGAGLSKDGSWEGCNMSGGEVEDFLCFGCEKYQNESVKDYKDDDDGPDPTQAIRYCLRFLGIRDLLSVERVCKLLRGYVRRDIELWKNIHIAHPLSDKITDDDLLRLTNKAQGYLSSLSLVKCSKITNDGLNHVLERNLRLTKLSVPGCIKLSVEGILHDLKVFNSAAWPGIKYLRIGELFGLTNEHFKEFKLLLGVDGDKKANNYKPRFYCARQLYLSLDDDERVLDIETCPRCQQARQVYDCPSESCKAEDENQPTTCRACTFCISRCLSCGCCLDNRAYEETFCLDLLCLDCLDKLFNYEDGVQYGPRYTYFHRMASYHLFLYG